MTDDLRQKNHIVTAGYLKAWREGHVVGVGWKRDDPGLPDRLTPDKVCRRTRFYVDHDPDGTPNDWFERELEKVEGPTVKVIRELPRLWPLAGMERTTVTEFLGLQYLRSPAYRAWFNAAASQASARLLTETPGRKPEAVVKGERYVTSDRGRQELMAEQLPVICAVFANMRWTLLQCGKPRLATSDHPLVVVPPGERSALSPICSVGIANIAEARFAVSPTLLLLMTWEDEYGPEEVGRLRNEAVRNHNSLVIGQAEQQWVHVPSRRPEYAARGHFRSIAETLPGSRGQTPFGTRRHEAVQQMVNEVAETRGPARRGIRLIDWASVRRQERWIPPKAA